MDTVENNFQIPLADPDPCSNSDAGPSRKGILAETLLLSMAILAIIFFLAHLLTFEYGRDQGIYTLAGDSLLEGKTPYKDIWDFKPPGIFFVYALARSLFGTGVEAVRILEALGLIGLFLGFQQQ